MNSPRFTLYIIYRFATLAQNIALIRLYYINLVCFIIIIKISRKLNKTNNIYFAERIFIIPSDWDFFTKEIYSEFSAPFSLKLLHRSIYRFNLLSIIIYIIYIDCLIIQVLKYHYRGCK